MNGGGINEEQKKCLINYSSAEHFFKPAVKINGGKASILHEELLILSSHNMSCEYSIFMVIYLRSRHEASQHRNRLLGYAKPYSHNAEKGSLFKSLKVIQEVPSVALDKKHVKQTRAVSCKLTESLKFCPNIAALKRAVPVTTSTLWMEKNATSATAGLTHAKLTADGKNTFFIIFLLTGKTYIIVRQLKQSE